MSTIVTPPAAPEVPPYPALGSPVFNQQAYAYGSAMPGISLIQWQIGDAAYKNAIAAREEAVTSAQAAVASTQASQLALAASNMKGAWSNLSGPLTVPSTVTHSGRFWVLTRDVPNVAAEVPGISTAWLLALGDRDRVIAMSASGVGDCSLGDYFTLVLTANTTLSFVNIPAGAYACAVEIQHTAGNLTLPAGSVWARNEVPDLIVGRRHLVYFQRIQLGTSGWYVSALPNFV